MNWMRFLAASQSFIGMKCKNSPYRVTQRSWLRMVGAICQPMQAAAVVTPSGAQAPGGARSMEGSSESSPLFTTPAAVARPTRSLSPGELTQAGRELSGPQPELSLPASATASGARSVSGMKSGRSKLFKMYRPLKQAELTLDTVQVVRNDLMETDLELIPMEFTKPSPARARVEASGAPPPGLGGLMMSRLAAGLVAARKTGD